MRCLLYLIIDGEFFSSVFTVIGYLLQNEDYVVISRVPLFLPLVIAY